MSREHHGYRFAIWIWVLALSAWGFLLVWALSGSLGLAALSEPRPRFWLFVLLVTTPVAFLIRHGLGWIAGTLRLRFRLIE